MPDKHLAFLGAGTMAEALARGLLSAGILEARQMVAYDVDETRREHFRRELGIEAPAEAAEAVDHAATVLVAVKPQQFDEALAPVASRFGPEKLVLTICAGVTTNHAESILVPGTRVVRAMPNIPMLVDRGMVAICKGSAATDVDLAEAERLLGAAAEVIRVPEDRMDAVTAVSGSGPAFFYYLTECLAEAGVAVGFAEADARHLARVTFEGAARLMAETGQSPADLREKVTTPGGTAEAALKVFEARNLQRILTEAVRAARDRGQELGR